MKPILWIAPLIAPSRADWFDLLDYADRTPVYDFTRKHTIEVELLLPLGGLAGVGLFATPHARNAFGIRTCNAVDILTGDKLVLDWCVPTMILPNHVQLTGASLRRFLVPSVQRAMVKAMARHRIPVQKGSELA